MKADTTRLMVRFLESDIPSSKQIDLPADVMNGQRAVISQDRVVIAGLNDAASRIIGKIDEKIAHGTVYMDEFLPSQIDFPWPNYEKQTDRVNRKRLIALLEAIDSENVDLRVCDDYPVIVCGLIGETLAAAAIARSCGATRWEKSAASSLT